MKYVLPALAIFSQEEEKERNLTYPMYEILINPIFNLVNIRGVVQHKWRIVLIRAMAQDFAFGRHSIFNLSPYAKSRTIARPTIRHLFNIQFFD